LEDQPSPHAARRLLRRTLALAGVVVAYHFALAWLMRSTGLVLGVVRPGTRVYRPVPLYCYFRPSLEFGLAAALVVLFGFWQWFRLVAWNTRRLRRGFVPAAMAWYVVLTCSVAMIDGGPRRLWRPYEKLHDTDYIGAIDRVDSARGFLGRYAEIQPTLPMHCRTHPPGGVLFLWAIDRYVWPGEAAAALATILAAALAVPAVHGLAREVGSRRTARLATALFLLAPNVLLFTATSMEAVFMVPMVWTFTLLFRARRRARGFGVALGVLGGLTASLSAMMSFSAAWLGVWAVVLLLLTAVGDRQRLASTLLTLAAAAVASLLFYALLYAWSGYNLLEVLRVALGQHGEIMEGARQATLRQYLHLTVANPIAFFTGTGLVLAVLWAQRTWKDLKAGHWLGWLAPSAAVAQEMEGDGLSALGGNGPDDIGPAVKSSKSKGGQAAHGTPKKLIYRALAGRQWHPAGNLLNLSFLGSLLIVVLLPLYTLEVERIWIFLVPLVAIAAARELQSARVAGVPARRDVPETSRDTGKMPVARGREQPGAAIRMAFLLLAIQVVFMETLLTTIW